MEIDLDLKIWIYLVWDFFISGRWGEFRIVVVKRFFPRPSTKAFVSLQLSCFKIGSVAQEHKGIRLMPPSLPKTRLEILERIYLNLKRWGVDLDTSWIDPSRMLTTTTTNLQKFCLCQNQCRNAAAKQLINNFKVENVFPCWYPFCKSKRQNYEPLPLLLYPWSWKTLKGESNVETPSNFVGLKAQCAFPSNSSLYTWVKDDAQLTRAIWLATRHAPQIKIDRKWEVACENMQIRLGLGMLLSGASTLCGRMRKKKNRKRKKKQTGKEKDVFPTHLLKTNCSVQSQSRQKSFGSVAVPETSLSRGIETNVLSVHTFWASQKASTFPLFFVLFFFFLFRCLSSGIQIHAEHCFWSLVHVSRHQVLSYCVKHSNFFFLLDSNCSESFGQKTCLYFVSDIISYLMGTFLWCKSLSFSSLRLLVFWCFFVFFWGRFQEKKKLNKQTKVLKSESGIP